MQPPAATSSNSPYNVFGLVRCTSTKCTLPFGPRSVGAFLSNVVLAYVNLPALSMGAKSLIHLRCIIASYHESKLGYSARYSVNRLDSTTITYRNQLQHRFCEFTLYGTYSNLDGVPHHQLCLSINPSNHQRDSYHFESSGTNSAVRAIVLTKSDLFLINFFRVYPLQTLSGVSVERRADQGRKGQKTTC